MFLPFFQTLREEGVPVSLREFLGFLEAMAAGLVIYDPEGFYHLARLTMVKDERHIDRFDRAFARAFGGLEGVTAEGLFGAASGRVEMDRDGGDLPVRGLWLQPGRGADRAGAEPPPARGQGLGPARVPQP